MSGTPHCIRTVEVDTPRISFEINILLMRLHTPVVIEIFHHEVLASARDGCGRRKCNLTAGELIHVIDADGITDISRAIKRFELIRCWRAVLGQRRIEFLKVAEVSDALVLSE